MPFAHFYVDPTVPASAKAGATVNIPFTLCNTGTDDGYLRGANDGPSNTTTPEYQWVTKGCMQMIGWTTTFIMPSSSIQLYVTAYSWDGSQWVACETRGPYNIAAASASAQARFWNGPFIPASAVIGSIIRLVMTLKNVGGASGLLQPWYKDSNVNMTGKSPDPFWLEVAPGVESGQFTLEFTMPSTTATFTLVARHWDGSNWVDDQSLVGTIAPDVAQGVSNLDCNYVLA